MICSKAWTTRMFRESFMLNVGDEQLEELGEGLWVNACADGAWRDQINELIVLFYYAKHSHTCRQRWCFYYDVVMFILAVF